MNVVFTALFIVLFLPSCKFLNDENGDMIGTDYNIEIEVLQDGALSKFNGESYVLKKKPFVLRFTVKESVGCFFNFSLENKLAKRIKEKNEFSDVLGFHGTAMAEESEGNPGKIVAINSRGWHYWTIENGAGRFDSIKSLGKGLYMVERDVENIHVINDKSNEIIPVKDISYDRIYVSFIEVKTEKKRMKIIGANSLTIDFK